MKRLILIALLLITALSALSTPQEAEARLATNNRRAVVLEAFNALRRSHDGSCDKTINGNCVSNWNYLASDVTSYSIVKGFYRCDSSVWAVQNDKKNKQNGCSDSDFDSQYVNFSSPVSFYSNISSYGYGTFGGSYGPVGRGGQCKFFANLLLYRSGADIRQFPTYQKMWDNTSSDWSKVKEGDVILTLGPPTHTAIVVEIKRDSRGSITAIDVIDSNYISDLEIMSNREVISRHILSNVALQKYRSQTPPPEAVA